MKEKLGVIDSISIGIGAMIGGGIFSVMGLAVLLAGSAAPISFLIGGFIAILVGYSYIKLSTVYKSEGGTFSYIARAFNPRMGGFSGWLLCIGYIGTLALYAYAFGIYGGVMLGLDNLGIHLLQSLVIIIFMIINLLGAKNVIQIEKIIVGIKVLILGFFIIAGLLISKPSIILHSDIEFSGIIMATALIFVAFEGFQLIPQGIKELKNPKKNIPWSIYISIISVMIIYTLISFVVTQTLNFDEINIYQEYVLAATAEPLFGNLGFLIIGIAALLSTTSAINATIFGTSRLSYIMATKKELPRFFSIRDKEKQIPRGAIIGISVITLIFVNFGSLISIASVASSIFIAVFLLINIAVIKKRKELNANLILPALGSILCFILFIELLSFLLINDFQAFTIVIGVFISTFILENIFKKTEMVREEIAESVDDLGERAFAEKLKEHDLKIRGKLIRENQKSKIHLKNIQSILKNNENINSIKKIVDILDIFSNDIEYSLSGRKYPIFSIQSSTMLKKLIKNYEDIIERMENITKSCYILEKKLIEKTNTNVGYELGELKKYFIEVKNAYNDRIHNIK